MAGRKARRRPPPGPPSLRPPPSPTSGPSPRPTPTAPPPRGCYPSLGLTNSVAQLTNDVAQLTRRLLRVASRFKTSEKLSRAQLLLAAIRHDDRVAEGGSRSARARPLARTVTHREGIDFGEARV
jgi:hypothetical protein